MASEDNRIQQLQLIEQKVQNLLVQKQNFAAQQVEIESALEQLKGKTKAFKIIGNIMVESDAISLVRDLTEKKKRVDMRIKSVEKQEEQLKTQAKGIQAEVLKSMKK